MQSRASLLFFLLSVISVNAQIYTPGGTIQGTSANNNVGIGTDTPATKLDVIGNGRISTALTVGLGSVVGNRFITLTPTTDTSMPNIQGVLAGTGPGSFTLQASGGNIGIGSPNTPTGKLDIFTGVTGISTSIAALPAGTFSFANNGSSTAVPTIFSKSSNSIGFSIFTGTNNTNVSQDMRFVVMKEDGTDFTTLTSSAFRFARYNTSLFEILRNGNVGIGNIAPVGKLDILGAKTTTYASSLSSPTNDFLRISNIHGSGGSDQYSALSLMVTGNYGSNNAYVNLAVIQPVAGNSNSEFALTVRKGSGLMNEVLRAKSDGKIGIGTSNPTGVLHVVDAAGGFFFDGSSTLYNRIKSTDVVPTTPKPLLISAQSSGTSPDIYIDTSGNVGLGTVSPASKLTVAGNIHSREVKVSVDAGADFVFQNNYNLPSLHAVDNYIKENKHLPEIASADEMKKHGINLSEMNIKLLQKVEELTLYTIEQQKNTEKLTEIIEVLSRRLEALERK